MKLVRDLALGFFAGLGVGLAILAILIAVWETTP